MGSLFGKKGSAKTTERKPRARPTLDQIAPPVARDVEDRNAPMKAPEVDLKSKIPAAVSTHLDRCLTDGCRALLLDPEEEETRFFAVFEDHLEEIGRAPVSGHAALLSLLDSTKGGAITVGALRYRLEMFKSFNEFGDRLTVQFFEESRFSGEEIMERRQANIRLVNRLKPATSLTAKNEADIYATIQRNPRERSFAQVLQADGALTEEQIAKVEPGDEYELRLLQHNIFPRKVAALSLAHYLGVEYVDVEEVHFSKEAARLLDKEWELQNQVVPFAQDGQDLKVAMMDPTDTAVVAAIEERTGCKVRPFLSAAQDILVMVHKGHKRDD